MTLQTFDFPYHGAPSDQYPESSNVVQFGKGYRYVTTPRGPDQIIFTLSFPGMFWYVQSNGTIDRSLNENRNMAALIDFYEAHRMHQYFLYNHPSRGEIRVRFYKPLVVPKTMRSDSRRMGVTEPFDVQLIYEP